MKNIILSIFLLAQIDNVNSQDNRVKYDSLIIIAYQAYEAKDYQLSATSFSNAFKELGWKAIFFHRYGAACSWALVNNSDSSFFQLNNLANKRNYSNYSQLTTDQDLISLHSDKRWEPLIAKVLANKTETEKNYNHELVAELAIIDSEDQGGRQRLDEIEQKYGRESKQMDSLWKDISFKDSINLIKIIKILDTYGWQGYDVLGQDGVTTQFLVIQHADLKTQEKYLPMMQEACKNGKFSSSSLALLEDRIANRNGKLQIYGSQVGFDKSKEVYYLLPVEDPDHIDERRAKMDLGPISEYVSNWDIIWDVEVYKKNLPYYLELQKKNN